MAAEHGPSDEALVQLAQEGALDAFSALYQRYLPMVYNRVRCVIPERDVEDVTQEVFIAVMRSLKSFRGESLFRTWLRTILSRQVADYYRQRSPAENPLETDTYSYLAQIPCSPVYTPGSGMVDDSILLRQALQRLPEHYREIIMLRFSEGLRFHEIAALQGQSLEAAKSLFRRAVSALQREMETANV